MKKRNLLLKTLAATILCFGGLSLGGCSDQSSVSIVNGSDGKDAYEIAVDNGFQGDVSEWLESLKGKDGIDGNDGKDGKNGNNGENGKSAYEIAVQNGYEGTLEEWLKTLNGNDGVGIANIYVDENDGYLYVVYTDSPDPVKIAQIKDVHEHDYSDVIVIKDASEGSDGLIALLCSAGDDAKYVKTTCVEDRWYKDYSDSDKDFSLSLTKSGSYAMVNGEMVSVNVLYQDGTSTIYLLLGNEIVTLNKVRDSFTSNTGYRLVTSSETYLLFNTPIAVNDGDSFDLKETTRYSVTFTNGGEYTISLEDVVGSVSIKYAKNNLTSSLTVNVEDGETIVFDLIAGPTASWSGKFSIKGTVEEVDDNTLILDTPKTFTMQSFFSDPITYTFTAPEAGTYQIYSDSPYFGYHDESRGDVYGECPEFTLSAGQKLTITVFSGAYEFPSTITITVRKI